MTTRAMEYQVGGCPRLPSALAAKGGLRTESGSSATKGRQRVDVFQATRPQSEADS